MVVPLRVHREGLPSRMEEPQGFAKSPEHAFDDPRLTKGDERVLNTLTFMAKFTFPEVCASHAEIASRARRCDRSVRRSMVQLEKYGYVRQVGRGKSS